MKRDQRSLMCVYDYGMSIAICGRITKVLVIAPSLERSAKPVQASSTPAILAFDAAVHAVQ